MCARALARALRAEKVLPCLENTFFLVLWLILARAKKILYLNSAHQNEQKKALAFFHIFKIERAGAA